MLYVDKDIKAFVQTGLEPNADPELTAIKNGSMDCITNIGYDLRAGKLYKEPGNAKDFCVLKPGEFVFVESKEHVFFNKNTIGVVSLKNSRIRMGLALDAPVYQPGHKTPVYFRLTNITNNELTISTGEKYAMLMLYNLNKAPEHPYDGPFQQESDFNGMGIYNSLYANQVKEVEEKTKNIKDIEKNLYGNVLTILTIFIGIFTLLNINIELVKAASTAKGFVCFNLAVIASLSFLGMLLEEVIHREEARHKLWWIPSCLYAVFLVAAIFL